MFGCTGEKHAWFGQTHSEETRKKHSKESRKKMSEAMNSINFKQKIRVITSSCCYFSMKDAYEELRISKNKFYKIFEKDPLTGFYIEKQKIV